MKENRKIVENPKMKPELLLVERNAWIPVML